MKKLYCTKLDRPHDAQGAKDGPGMLAAEQQVPAWPEEPQRLTAGRYGEVQWGYAEYRGDFDYIGRKYEFDRAEAAIARLKRVTEWMKGRMPCASGECCDELRQMIELCEVPNE